MKDYERLVAQLATDILLRTGDATTIHDALYAAGDDIDAVDDAISLAARIVNRTLDFTRVDVPQGDKKEGRIEHDYTKRSDPRPIRQL